MPQKPEDPVLISARREAWIVFFTWITALIWSVSYCYFNGYLSDLSKISDKSSVKVVEPSGNSQSRELWVDSGKGFQRINFILGFPDWVFFGVIGPWWICSAFSIFFGAYVVRDEDLGAESETSWQVTDDVETVAMTTPISPNTQKGVEQ